MSVSATITNGQEYTEELNVFAIIPARGGSKGVHRKNIKPLAGKPLIAYTIEAALNCKLINRTIVSTEDKEIATVAKRYGVEVIKRPDELAQDGAPVAPVLLHVLTHLKENEDYGPDVLVLLQPTSPLRNSKDITSAIELFMKQDCKSVISVCEAPHPPYWSFTIDKNNFLKAVFKKESEKQRQELHKTYLPDGAIYITSLSFFLKNKSFFSGKTLPYLMPPERSVDIDKEIDFEFAKFLISRQKKKNKIKIGNRYIGENESCFIIAEAGVNHNGDINLAKKLIDAAKKAEADAVKFQSFKAENIVTKSAEKAAYQGETTEPEESHYEMIKKFELTNEEFVELADYAMNRGIVFLSTPFDKGGVDMLDEIGVPAFKIASGEITNFPLLKHAAKKGKPLILSTGMSTLEEMEEALTTVRREGVEDIVLLHCVTSYPAKIEDMNLRVMDTLKQTFKLPVGLSDHTLGIEIPIAAVALGAVAVEKHFTLDRNLPGPDHKTSLEPEEFKEMVKAIRDVEKALGNGIKKLTKAEEEIKKVVRRSIVTRVGIPKGTVITEEMLDFKRPGIGLKPKHLSKIIGRRAKKNMEPDELVTFDKLAW